ncbi:MAG TPA: 50S ribosomal protein L9 [Acidimicrobiales bacterium]|nr:50S ribosomal protein L9 [Acidimicrobiales bacterium]
MRVLLRDDVEGVGRRGDLVEVTGGFARNFLLPTGRALKATAAMATQAAAMRRSRDLRDAKDKEAAEAVAAALAGRTLTVSARSGVGGRLFGSVTTQDLADAIQAQTGAVVDRRRIRLEEPIRSVGTHVVPVHLHAEVETELTVEVVPAG